MPSKRKRKTKSATEPNPFKELGLNPDEWRVKVDFSKSIFHSTRGVAVHVHNLGSGRETKAFEACTTKRECRQLAVEMVRTALKELR